MDINPHLIQPTTYKRVNMRFAGGKVYHARFSHLISRRYFKRQSEAEAYGSSLHARWIRLYDLKLAAMFARKVPAE